ncbi:MAG: Fic family protein [Kofleriaceae bacterium]
MPIDALLCPPEEKAEREAANGVEQIDYLTDLVVGERSITQIRESHLLDLQKLAVATIYPCGGTYRDARTKITISDSEHEPPDAAHVSGHIIDLLEYLNSTRSTVPALERAAYALWRLNWIHPFRGGNGRTSRCLAYLIICMDLGMMVPGMPTLPTRIYDKREEYVTALKAADAALREAIAAQERLPVEQQVDPQADLSVMKAYLQDLVTEQMASAIKRLASPSH